MKNFRNTALLVLFSAGTILAQDNNNGSNTNKNNAIVVQGEKKLNVDFKKYKTFGWVQADKPQGNQLVEYTYAEAYDVNAPVRNMYGRKKHETRAERKEDKRMVKEEKKMEKSDQNKEVVIYSYSFVIPSGDSMINNSAIHAINEELEGRGYRKSATPDLLVAYKIFDQSTQIKGYNAPPTKLDGGEVRQPQDTVTYALQPGTVLISLIDAKTSAVVWEGYASGVAQNNAVISDRMRVKEAINLIFEKFKFRADKYSVNN